MKNTVLFLGYSLFSVAIIGCNDVDQKENKDPDTLVATAKDPQKINTTNAQFGGKYEFGDDIEKGPVGLISVYPLSDSTALFYLDVNRGAPSYNMGLLAGKMRIAHNIGIYNSEPIDNEKGCVIKFTFGNNQLQVNTDANKDDCGFGFNVYADHSYKLVDNKIPDFYINGEGDTILFKGLKLK